MILEKYFDIFIIRLFHEKIFEVFFLCEVLWNFWGLWQWEGNKDHVPNHCSEQINDTRAIENAGNNSLASSLPWDSLISLPAVRRQSLSVLLLTDCSTIFFFSVFCLAPCHLSVGAVSMSEKLSLQCVQTAMLDRICFGSGPKRWRLDLFLRLTSFWTWPFFPNLFSGSVEMEIKCYLKVWNKANMLKQELVFSKYTTTFPDRKVGLSV